MTFKSLLNSVGIMALPRQPHVQPLDQARARHHLWSGEGDIKFGGQERYGQSLLMVKTPIPHGDRLADTKLLLPQQGRGPSGAEALDQSRFYSTINCTREQPPYSPILWQIVAHILVLGFAAQAAGLVYFLTTLRDLAPRYRIASVLGSISR